MRASILIANGLLFTLNLLFLEKDLAPYGYRY